MVDAGFQNGVVRAPLGAEHAPQDPMQLAPAEAQPSATEPAAAEAPAAEPAPAEPAADTERKRRHKWGPPAAGEFANEEQKPKKRRSRWESSTDIIVPTSNAGQIIIPGQLPKEVTICGGMKVRSTGTAACWGQTPRAAVACRGCLTWPPTRT